MVIYIGECHAILKYCGCICRRNVEVHAQTIDYFMDFNCKTLILVALRHKSIHGLYLASDPNQ